MSQEESRKPTPLASSSSVEEPPSKSGKKRLTKEVEEPKSKRNRFAKRNVLLWEKFDETYDQNVVVCKQCKAKIRRPDGSTSGMKSHFETRHPVQYIQYLKKSMEATKEKVCVLTFLPFTIVIIVYVYLRNSQK